MNENDIYEAIAERTGGDIYLGVVGPVRTGKSTFIQKFLETAVLPRIENDYDRERTQDEMPQGGSGKTITTTEPKFVPGEAVAIEVGKAKLSVRLIDCVGYMVEGAQGALEDGEWRMVTTPWSAEPIPFAEAAKIGTEKVAREHSTVAVMVTTDGSFTDIPREAYAEAEATAITALTEAKKPFAIILNSALPESDGAKALALELEDKYQAPVALLDCTKLSEEDVVAVLSMTLGEFPLRELKFKLPEWTSYLPEEHGIRLSLMETVTKFAESCKRFSDTERAAERYSVKLSALDAGRGTGELEITLPDEEYYKALGELSGLDVNNSSELFATVISLAEAKREYDKVSDALYEARTVGYGIVMPTKDELTVSEPSEIKSGGVGGIKIGASGESIHMIRANVKTEVCPTFGSDEQAAEVIKRMRADYEDAPASLLETKMFGRSLYDMVNDGMNAKLMHLPPDARTKMGQTVEKIINEGASGLICILL